MKPVDDKTLDDLESVINPSVKAIKDYLAYQGENPQYRDRARVAIGLVGAFARVRASESNRMQVELISHRVAVDRAVRRELQPWQSDNELKHDEPMSVNGNDDDAPIRS